MMELAVRFMVGVFWGIIAFCVGYRAATQKWHVRSRWIDGRCQNCGGQGRLKSIGFGCTPGSIRVNYEETKYYHHCGAMMR